ncbi:MAG: ribosome biogenesis GTPase Der [Dehalococcoidia bacterium]|nr:ribosome biogenesis GTPase Der [Dehalococcoidia bacterium]
MNPIISIVGRPNVGKSTLFNRIAGAPIAIVEDLPGTTRDRIFADVSMLDHEVTLIDTGGLEPVPGSEMGRKVKKQVEAAIAGSDLIIFVVDARDGLIAADSEIADNLRRLGKDVVLAANKAETEKQRSSSAEFYQLGLGEPLPISAHHGRGIHELLEAVVARLPAPSETVEEAGKPKLAIVGRPNVGKSLLVNAVAGSDRTIVDPTAGTTRDATDTVVKHGDREVVLIDTAGIRKRGKAGVGLEYYGLVRTLRAINRCDVAMLVMDATEFITAQDTHVAGYIKEACKGIVLVVNKWDLADPDSRDDYVAAVDKRMKFIAHAPILFVSALTGLGVKNIIPVALEAWDERQKLLPDDVIDGLVKEAVASHAPPPHGTKRLEVYRAYQGSNNPPTFTFLVNDPLLVHFSYERYLENRLRQTFGFYGTSLKLIFKKASRKSSKATGVNS